MSGQDEAFLEVLSQLSYHVRNNVLFGSVWILTNQMFQKKQRSYENFSQLNFTEWSVLPNNIWHDFGSPG